MPTISDWIQIVVSIFLGIAALVFARTANKATKEANKIAIIDKIYKIHNFFITEIAEPNFFDFSNINEDNFIYSTRYLRIEQILSESFFIFDSETYEHIEEKCESIREVFRNGKFPSNDSIVADELSRLVFLADIQQKVKYMLHEYRVNKSLAI